MVFTPNQTTSFFENANQMAILHATVLQLSQEVIVSVADLIDFDKESIKQIAENLRRPGGRVRDPDDPGSTIPTPPFVFGAKSQTRLVVACHLVRFYTCIGRPLSPSNMQWENVIRNFNHLWKAIVARRAAEDPATPLITKALPIIKWTEAFRDHLYRCIGSRHISLAYVVRDSESVAGLCLPLKTDQPYSDKHGSVDDDLIVRASHVNGLFRDYNADVYFKLEEATHGTAYYDSIKPYTRRKYRQSAFSALVAQYADKDKWESEFKSKDLLLHNRKWKGLNSYRLELFVQAHRAAFVSMTVCSAHVSHQLPNGHTRIRYLLDGIEAHDASLLAQMAAVEADTEEGEK